MEDVKIKLEDIEYHISTFIDSFDKGVISEKKNDMIQDIYNILKECIEIFNLDISKELRREIYIFNELYHLIMYKELQLTYEMHNDINYNISYYIAEFIEPVNKLVKNSIIELENYKINDTIPFVIQYVSSSSLSTSTIFKDKHTKLRTGSVLHNDLNYTLNSIVSNIMVDNCNILVNNFIEYEDELYSKYNCSMEQSLIEVKYFYNNKWNTYDLIRNQELIVLYKRIYEKVHPSYNHI